MDSVVISVLLIIVVAVVILLMKNIENSKKMDALRNDAIERSKQKEAEYNARKIQTVTPSVVTFGPPPPPPRSMMADLRRMDGTYRGEPRRQVPADGNRTQTVWGSQPTLAIDVPPLEMIPVPDDIETVGDQSLTLDEDQSQEYDEMAAVSGIREVAPPQTDENWVNSRQVEPVKDLSVGIAITNDVSKKENLQTGKISSKFPIIHKGRMHPPRIPNAARRVAMQQVAQRAAQQQRDSEIRNVIDKRARSMAKAAEMEKRARNDNSGIKQYDIPKGRKGPSLGLMKPAVMPIGYNEIRAAEKAAMMSAVEGYEIMKPWGSMVY